MVAGQKIDWGWEDEVPCPVCGKYSFEEFDDSDICPYCQWENDGLQYKHPDMRGGANTNSLNEERAEWRANHPEENKVKPE